MKRLLTFLGICFILISCKTEEWDNHVYKTDKPIIEVAEEGEDVLVTLINNKSSSWEVSQYVLETIGNQESQLVQCEQDELGNLKGEWYTLTHTESPDQFLVSVCRNDGETRKACFTLQVDDDLDLLLVIQKGKE